MTEEQGDYYELGNCLRGYFYGRFKSDDEAWEALSEKFNNAYPSREGRSVELRKTVRWGETKGGNETERDRELRLKLDAMKAESALKPD